MTAVHSSFSIERTYPSPASRVFAAFANQETKRRWFAEGEGWEVDEFTVDFRVGGIEKARFKFKGNAAIPPAPMANDTVYMDIVADQRIVLAYSMAMNDKRFSVSLATIELTPTKAGTRLVYTEQAAFFDGADGPKNREAGCREMLEKLGAELASQGANP